jgi:hypothetical protein
MGTGVGTGTGAGAGGGAGSGMKDPSHPMTVKNNRIRRVVLILIGLNIYRLSIIVPSLIITGGSA